MRLSSTSETGTTRRSTRTRRPRRAAHRADHDRAATVDVAVEQAVQGDDRLVVGRRGVDEVDHQAGLLAGGAAGDAADPLLVDAARGGRGQVHADRRPGQFHPSASSIALQSTSTSPRSKAARISASSRLVSRPRPHGL